MARALDAIEAFVCWLLLAAAGAAVALLVGAAWVWVQVTSLLIALSPWWPVLAGIALIFAAGR